MKPTPIISGYMVRHFLTAFLSLLLMIVGLILLFDTVELLRRTASRPEVGFGLVLKMSFMKLPQLVHTILPFAVMFGAMLQFWRLTRTHELIVLRAVGVSVWEFLLPVLVTAFLIGTINITAFNPLAAMLYKSYERVQDDLMMRHSNPLAFSEHGLWLREKGEETQEVIHAENVRQEEFNLHLRNVSILVFSEDDRFLKRFEADRAALKEGYFAMENVWEMEPGHPTRRHATLMRETSLTLGKIQENFSSPKTLSFWQLPEFISFFESAGFSARRHRLHWLTLLVSPFLLCTMVLVAAVFSLRTQQRQGGLMIRVGGGVAAGFLLYFFSRLTHALGLSSTLPLSLAAWSPALICALLSLSFLLHKEDG